MFCPRCGKESGGKWCPNCGTQLEIEEKFGLNPYEETQRLPRLDEIENELGKAPDTQAPKTAKSYYTPEEENHDLDGFDPYGDYAEDECAKRKKLIAIVSVCVAGLIIVAAILAFVLSSKPSGGDIDVPSSSEDARISELVSLGEKYMAVGNYKEAESVYGELMTLSDDGDTAVIYKILYNYNLAVKELENSDFKAAQKYFDKIPDDYPNYFIIDDIEALSDDIAKYKLASDIFETVEDLMNNGDYDEADTAILSMDESLLSADNQKKLEKYKNTIEESRKKDEEADLTEIDAEILLKEYKAGVVQAVKSGNIDTASYIQKGSPLYNQTIKLIADCSANGETIVKEETKFVSVTRIDGTSWQIKADETDTFADADGNEDKKSYTNRYVVKYIEGDYYFTDVQ